MTRDELAATILGSTIGQLVAAGRFNALTATDLRRHSYRAVEAADALKHALEMTAGGIDPAELLEATATCSRCEGQEDA